MWWRKPSTPTEPTAKEVGYSDDDDADVVAGPAHDLVPPGYIAQGDDEYYSDEFSGGKLIRQWRTFRYSAPELVGEVIKPDDCPVRRTKKVVAASGPAKWSCGHGRDPADKYCIVCIIFNRNVTK